MGTKEELPEVPEIKTKFVEDMNERELATAVRSFNLNVTTY